MVSQTSGSASSSSTSTTAVLDSLFPSGQSVATDKSLLVKLKKNAAHSNYWASQAKKKHGWSERQLFQRSRGNLTSAGKKSMKSGAGKPEWRSTKDVLRQMVKDMSQ